MLQHYPCSSKYLVIHKDNCTRAFQSQRRSIPVVPSIHRSTIVSSRWCMGGWRRLRCVSSSMTGVGVVTALGRWLSRWILSSSCSFSNKVLKQQIRSKQRNINHPQKETYITFSKWLRFISLIVPNGQMVKNAWNQISFCYKYNFCDHNWNALVGDRKIESKSGQPILTYIEPIPNPTI